MQRSSRPAAGFALRPEAGLKAVWADAFFRRLACNSSWGVGATVLEFALGLAEIALVARALGVADYGRLALVMAAIAAIKLLVDVRAWEGATRYLAEFLAKREPGLALATLKLALLADALVGLVAYGATVALAGLLGGRLLHQPALQGLIRWYALSLLFTAVNGTAEAVLRVFDRFQDLAARRVVQAGWHLGLVATVVLGGGRMRGLIFAYLLSDLAGAALLVGLAGRQVQQRLWAARAAARVRALRPYLREMLWFTAHTALRATLKLNRQVGILVLGHFASPAEVGYFRVARRLGASIQELSDPFYYAIFPEFARSRGGRQGQLAQVVARTARAATLGVLPVVLGGVLFAPALIRAWVGPSYTPAIGPFRVILVAMAFAIATFWGTPAALGSGRPDIATHAVAAGVLVDLLLLFLLVPHHGAMGAAVSLLGGSVAFAVSICALLARTLRGTPSYTSASARPVVSSESRSRMTWHWCGVRGPSPAPARTGSGPERVATRFTWLRHRGKL